PENAYPPNAEMAVLYGLAFVHRDTFATLPQLAAQLSFVPSIYGIARKLGFARPASFFPALLALTLSNVALESMTALNDLVVASFVAAAVFFLLPPATRTGLALAGAAVGLALGTKYSAL